MKKIINFDQLLAMAAECGLANDGFSAEKFFFCALYRAFIVALLSEYFYNKTNITNTKYSINDMGEIKEYCIIIELDGVKMKDVGQCVTTNLDNIPFELRHKFYLIVGYNYGDEGGFIVHGNEIKYISQDEFMNSAESDGSLTGEIIEGEVYLAMRKLIGLIKG